MITSFDFEVNLVADYGNYAPISYNLTGQTLGSVLEKGVEYFATDVAASLLAGLPFTLEVSGALARTQELVLSNVNGEGALAKNATVTNGILAGPTLHLLSSVEPTYVWEAWLNTKVTKITYFIPPTSSVWGITSGPLMVAPRRKFFAAVGGSTKTSLDYQHYVLAHYMVRKALGGKLTPTTQLGESVTLEEASGLLQQLVESYWQRFGVKFEATVSAHGGA